MQFLLFFQIEKMAQLILFLAYEEASMYDYSLNDTTTIRIKTLLIKFINAILHVCFSFADMSRVIYM